MQSKEIKPVNLKGNPPWIFTGMTDAETEVPILWPPDAKSWFTEKDPDARKDGGQEEKGTIGDEMVGWHHRHNGHGFGWTPGVGDGQGGLACCSSRGRKESDRLSNWTELNNLKQSRWHWSHYCMTNFKITVRADCAVSACSALPLSIKASTPWVWGWKLASG